jgi:chromatin assembly factor 1 subunit B
MMYRSIDGLTLLMTSSDGFCSTLTFAAGELGQVYTGETPTAKHPSISSATVSAQSTPLPTPTSVIAPPSPFRSSNHQRTSSNLSIAPSPPPAPAGPSARPFSPTRSNSTSSVGTQASYVNAPAGTVISNPPLLAGNISGVVAGNPLGFIPSIPMTTPPQTPRSTTSSVSGVKREAGDSEKEDGGHEKKRRRIAPTLVGDSQASNSGSEPSA